MEILELVTVALCLRPLQQAAVARGRDGAWALCLPLCWLLGHVAGRALSGGFAQASGWAGLVGGAVAGAACWLVIAGFRARPKPPRSGLKGRLGAV